MPHENDDTSNSTPEGNGPAEGSEPEGQEPEGTPNEDDNTEGDDDGNEPEPKPEDELPEWARKELSRARGEAANYRTKLRDAEKKLGEAKTTEEFEAAVNELREENAKLERAVLVSGIAQRFELPKELSEVLKGDTEEEITAHAKTLAKFAGVESDVNDLEGGLTPRSRDTDPDDPGELAAKFGRGRKKRG